MGHEPEELEDRIARCEHTLDRCVRSLFGDDDSSKGLSARTHMNELAIAKIDSGLSKIVWLLILAIITQVLNGVLNRGSAPHGGTQSTSVITSDAASAIQAAKPASHRDYLTTAEVAALEAKSVREVQDMIIHGEITPQPAKDGREYRIAADYRIQPQPAANCGTAPQ